MKRIQQYFNSLRGYYSISTIYLALQIVGLASNFVITPLVIAKLGNITYVLWLTVNAFSALILFADWGFLNTFRVKMTEIYLKEQTFPESIWKNAVKYLHISALLLTFLLTLSINYFPFFSEYSGYHTRIFLALGFMATYATLYENLYLVKYQIQSSEFNALRIMLISRVFDGVTQVALLLIHPSIYSILISSLFFRIASLGMLKNCAPKSCNSSPDDFANEVTIKVVFKESVGGSMFILSNVVYANILTLVLSFSLPTNLLVNFQLTRMLVSPIRMMGSAIATGTLQQNLKRTHNHLTTRFHSSFSDTSPSIGLLLITSLSVLIFASHIWSLFFPNVPNFRQDLLLLLSIQYFLDSFIWLISRNYFNHNRLLKIGMVNLIISLLGVASVQYFANRFSVLGIPLALILCDMILISVIVNPRGRAWLIR